MVHSSMRSIHQQSIRTADGRQDGFDAAAQRRVIRP
jgi:hypothetical protein